MKKKLLISTLVALTSLSSLAVDWQNPLVMCPEEILPKGIPCLDFSKVKDVYADFPDSASVEVMKDWKANKAADLKLCRNREVLRRETEKAGTFSPATIEAAWMVSNGGEKVSEKLQAIQAASAKYEIPAQILMGAMKQESLLSTLGVSPDGGNYSCGMSQLNIQEWCSIMNKQSEEVKANLGWPSSISCEDDALPTTIVKPFYDIAIKQLGSRPSYQLRSDDFTGITQEQVVSSFPSGSSELQEKRFSAISSFVNHCQDINLSIDFKARTLRGLFLNFVPKELREKNLYTDGKTFNRTCATPYTLKAYPLHTGWLLAVAMYNAGPRQKDLFDHYFSIENNNYPELTPLDLIEALHWGGKYKKRSDNVVFENQNGDKLTQTWFKSCIVQRHVARVIQHATLPVESIAKSLEQGGCRPNDGVPEYRQKTSGKKE